MKVNNSNICIGKMIIRYTGRNELLKSPSRKMREIYMHHNKDLMTGISENMVIETALFDGTPILFSLCNHKLYYKTTDKNDEFWQDSESSFINFEYINVDNEYVIFDAQIILSKENIPHYKVRENYHIILIFRNSTDWMRLLNKHNIEYQFHSYPKPELQDEI